jgi:hypothetical protein
VKLKTSDSDFLFEDFTFWSKIKPVIQTMRISIFTNCFLYLFSLLFINCIKNNYLQFRQNHLWSNWIKNVPFGFYLFTTRTTSDLSHQLFTLSLRLKENRFDYIDFSFKNEDTVFLLLPILFCKTKIGNEFKTTNPIWSNLVADRKHEFSNWVVLCRTWLQKKMHQKETILRATIFLWIFQS